MEAKDLTTYLGDHCHFKFRNGRDIYGVIFENNAKYFFSSKERHDSLVSEKVRLSKFSEENFDQIDPSELVLVKKLID